eukprot:TRINITY_DN1325_c0_g1_i1.p1 TRINITY_DN1325_c0_g1~~TRINITY_DN1325_c0_g1_i1.p1  ORF type:complete len:782 (+),score=119.10 TRINITY_DN1325_c0_g1_i1:141-2486(+)
MSKADSALVRVFLIDGTFKTFLVKKSDTVHSFKDQIAKKLKVDPTTSNQYGLFVLTDNRKVDPIIDNPFELHVRWGTQSGTTRKFLFKRLDEVTTDQKTEEDKTKRRPSLFIKRPPSKSVTNSLKKPLEPSAFASSTYLTPLGSTANNSNSSSNTATTTETRAQPTVTRSSPSTPVNNSMDAPDFAANDNNADLVVGSLPTRPSFSSLEVNIGSGHSSNEWPAQSTKAESIVNTGSPHTPARRPGPSVSRPLPKTPAFSPVLSGLKRAPSVSMQNGNNNNGGLARKSSASWSVPSNNNVQSSVVTPEPVINVQEAIKEVMHDEYAAKSERDERSKKIIIGWINRHLANRGMEITNLTTDLQDGVYLINLLEEVSGKKLEFYVKKPDNMTKKIDNLNLFIKFLSHLGLKVTGVSAMDIYSGNENIMLAILLLIIKNDQNLNKSTFARARLPSSGATLSIGGAQNRKSLGVHREFKDGESSPTSSPPSSLSSVSFLNNPRDSLPPLVQVQNSPPVVRPTVSVVSNKQRADSKDFPPNLSTSPKNSDFPSFTAVSTSPNSNEFPSFNHTGSDIPSFSSGASGPQGHHTQQDNAPRAMMHSLSFEDMDRKSKRMSSAVWLSDDIKQQLFLFHEDLPQHESDEIGKHNATNDIFDGPFLLKDAEPIEPDLDWDDPDRFDPEKVLLDLGDEEPLFPKEEKEVPFVFDDVEVLSLKALKDESTNVVEALDISFELPRFGSSTHNYVHEKMANARSILRNDRASVFGLEQFSSMEDVLTTVADEFQLTI